MFTAEGGNGAKGAYDKWQFPKPGRGEELDNTWIQLKWATSAGQRRLAIGQVLELLEELEGHDRNFAKS